MRTARSGEGSPLSSTARSMLSGGASHIFCAATLAESMRSSVSGMYRPTGAPVKGSRSGGRRLAGPCV